MHAFSLMTIGFALAIAATKVDLLQPIPAMLAMAVAALADWGIQIGLAALFNRTADVVPGPFIWLAAVALNTIVGIVFYRLVARRGSFA